MRIIILLLIGYILSFGVAHAQYSQSKRSEVFFQVGMHSPDVEYEGDEDDEPAFLAPTRAAYMSVQYAFNLTERNALWLRGG